MVATFYGIGVGPGDPELLTLKARRILVEVPVISYPVSGPGRTSVALEIVRDQIPSDKELLPLALPMSRRAEVLSKGWREAGEAVAVRLAQGADVAFITLGDPGVYSTFIYLARAVTALQPQTEVITVPGIPSFCAAAAAVNLSLAEGDETLAVIPAADNVAAVERALADHDNVVLLKVNRALADLPAALDRHGLAGKAVFLSRVGSPQQIVERDLAALAGKQLDYLSLVLVSRRGGG